MAYSPSEKYPGAVDVDPDYQGGKFRDNNPSTTNNGSPLKAIDRNELLARDEAIMNDAGFEYSGVADTPQDSQLFKAYKASLGNGANLLSNHNFLIQTPDDTLDRPDATPRSYPPGYQIFSGVFANETTGITNLTYIDGRVSFSGGDFYMPVANTGAIARLTSDQLTASVADFDGKPRTRGVSFALVGDEYRVTVGIDALEDVSAALTPLGSVKFEQGKVATGHEVELEVGNARAFKSIGEMVLYPLLSEGDVVSTGATTWKIVSTSGLPINNGLFAIALNGLWMNDFEMSEMDPSTGVGSYNDAQVAEAETIALLYGWTKKLNSGWYRLQDDWIMKSATSGMGSENTVVVFDSGKGFRNYENDTKYLIKKIKGIKFLSDKESKWNATDAGDAYVSGILRWDVRNLYGQRVAKGNKTTTPNNILSNDPQEQQDGNGFWFKDTSQWIQADGVAPDREHLPKVEFTGDENVLALSGDRKVITECELSGFEKNLVISGGYENDINNNVFRNSNYGIVTFNESYTGGSSSNKVTATNIDKNSFYDCDVSHYANDFLQSKFRDNVCQPSIVGMFVGGGGAPQTEVSGNYFEIGHTFFEHFPNLPMRGEVRNNFTNSGSTRYLGWASNGQLLNFMEPKDQNQKIHFDAGVQTSRIEQGFDLDVNGGFFVDNGNEYSAGVTKEYYIKTTGVGGTTFTITPLSKEFNISLTIEPSQSGIVIPNTPKGRLNLINVQMLSGKSIATYFDPQVGDPRDNRTRFFWDTVSDSAIDLQVDGQVKIIKITYGQEPTFIP